MGDASDIFVSYAREDEARIAPLTAALERRGWSVFWDRHVPPGQTWRVYIGRALQQARCLIVAWSDHSIGSEWVLEEAERAKRRGILVPVLLDPVDPPLGFGGIQAADLVGWGGSEDHPGFRSLASSVGDTLDIVPPGPTSRSPCSRLRLALVSPEGEAVRFGETDDAPPAYFYYVRVRNELDDSIWRKIRVLIKRIRKFSESEELLLDYQTNMQLKWQYGPGRCHERSIASDKEDTANLGLIIRGYGFFQLDICSDPWPDGFPARLDARQRMCIDMVAETDGAGRSNDLTTEIIWDGEWRDHPKEMQKHLLVKEVTSRLPLK